MIFNNIDSFGVLNQVIEDFFDLDYLESRLKKNTKGFWKKEIYLVSPHLMDILYPPNKRRGIDFDKMFKNYTINIERFDLPKWRVYENQRNIAIGLYVHDFNSSRYEKRIIKKLQYAVFSKIKNIAGPVIFICPERIRDIALSDFDNYVSIKDFGSNENTISLGNFQKSPLSHYSNVMNVLFLKVCLHEMAHHYMCFGKSTRKIKFVKVNKVAEKLIEESLANVFAWSQFNDPEELKIIGSFMDSQPFEYKAYRYWIKNGELKNSVPFLISSWKNRQNIFLPHFLFKSFDEIFANYFYANEYNRLSENSLNFEFDKERLNNNSILKINEEKNNWEAIAKSMIYYFYELHKKIK